MFRCMSGRSGRTTELACTVFSCRVTMFRRSMPVLAVLLIWRAGIAQWLERRTRD